MSSFDRRALLRAMGLGGLATFLPSLRASAQTTVIPRRFLIFFTQHGELQTLWKPKGVGGGEPTENAWELADLHQALKPFKSKLNLLSGLDFQSRILLDNSRAFGNGHQQGASHALSPFPQTTDGGAGGITIDQFIAADLKKRGQNTLLSSLHINVTHGDPRAAGQKSPSYSAAGQYVPSEHNPLAVYDRLFPGGPPTTGPGADPQAGSGVLQKKSVLDFVAKEFARAKPELGRIDREKLVAHGEAVRDLERSLSTNSVPTAGCSAFPRSTLEGVSFGKKDPKTWTTTSDQMAKLIQVAFACDLTRVINLGLAHPNNELINYTPGAFGTPTIHELEHLTGSRGGQGNAGAVAITAAARKRYVDVFAKVLGLLDAIPEGDGQTMLDHTAVLWSGEVTEGNHSIRNAKWMLAGSCGGAFKTGRYLQYGSNFYAGAYEKNPGSVFHADLFISIARAMGSTVTSFGMPGASTGPLSRL